MATVATHSSHSHSPSNSQSSSTNPPPPPPSASPPPPPPPPPASTSHPSYHQKPETEEEDTAMDTGVSGQLDNKKPHVHDGFQDFTAEEILKYQKYESDYACRLRAKYFSNKDIYGGDIFEVTFKTDNESIKASRWPPTQSYVDPMKSYVDHGNVLAHEAETPLNIANGNVTPPKKST